MSLFLTVLQIVAPVFILAAIGYIWVRTGHEYKVEFVTRLTMTLSVPCLIFTALMKTEVDPAALTAISLAAVVAYGVLTVIAALVLKLTRLPMRSYLAPMIFGNTGNLGLPVAMFAFGEAGLGYAVVVFAIMAIWSFTFGIWVVAGGGSLVRALKEPLLWATLLGGLFLSQGWHTPLFVTHALELVGQIAIPLMLITLGVAVARLRPGEMKLATGLSLLKYLLCVAVAWGTGRAFGLDPVAFAVLVIQISTPVAVTSFLLAEKYGADSDAVAGLVVISTLMSVLAIPLLLALVL
ncbi:AEC family transporter [Pseudooceanicola sp. CBS1P-1]|uniref:AEC family transporter n=1 Tax=Pseudooceanicola albus TaxID=2692189 RepID=A0A6L7G9P4_9RHOB|nr:MULTISPECIES: AEC family transporter [Pseudooceanicola]MBT9386684.1 AEC family transporter [Pseudooceanicola endophyticus]MXN20904.1 AEC family transporter [Pseudooceanicola albus]